MYAQPGDWLVIKTATLDRPARRGLVMQVHNTDGTPPYVVQWADNGHEAIVFPGPDAHIESAATSEV